MSQKDRSDRRWHPLLGLGLLLTAPLQAWGGITLLRFHPAHPVTLLGIIAALVLFTSPLTLIGGIGELSGWIATLFSEKS